jgi:hypothetical protein
MTRLDPKPATQLAAVLARETRKVPAFRVAKDAEALIALGRRAERIALQRCNGVERWNAEARQYLASWDESDEARADKATANVEAKVRKILEPYGATRIRAHGDPRGFVLRFKLKSGASNGMGEGWGV